MKKTFLLTLLLTAISCLALPGAKAQLAGTKWKGIVKIPNQDGDLTTYGVTWLFTRDTATMLYDDGPEPEVMTYTATDHTAMLKKVSGSVPCDTLSVAKISYEIRNDQLWIKPVSDDCKARAHVDISAPFDRIQ